VPPAQSATDTFRALRARGSPADRLRDLYVFVCPTTTRGNNMQDPGHVAYLPVNIGHVWGTTANCLNRKQLFPSPRPTCCATHSARANPHEALQKMVRAVQIPAPQWSVAGPALHAHGACFRWLRSDYLARLSGVERSGGLQWRRFPRSSTIIWCSALRLLLCPLPEKPYDRSPRQFGYTFGSEVKAQSARMRRVRSVWRSSRRLALQGR